MSYKLQIGTKEDPFTLILYKPVFANGTMTKREKIEYSWIQILKSPADIANIRAKMAIKLAQWINNYDVVHVHEWHEE